MNLNPATPVLSISAFNHLIQQTLLSSVPLTWIAGEISGLTRAASGHWYFSLKDATAQVRCVMFRGRNQYLDWQPENGMQVEVRATPSLYEARGEFQLLIDTLRRAGTGLLFVAFEQLKRQLALEGLFEPSRKRAIPAMPRRLGIITSPQAAALQDVLTTLWRQMPSLPILLYPCQVQGATAAAQIVAALNQAYLRAECDVLIICRGGGSMEDLWPFNEELVARAVAASPMPIISGIGHETDFTITDFVADLRAPTPTAAAILATTHHEQWEQRLDAVQVRMSRYLNQQINQQQQQINRLRDRLIHPGRRLGAQRALVGQLTSRLRESYQHLEQRHSWQYSLLSQRLQRLLPRLAPFHNTLLQQQQRLVLALNSRFAQYQTLLEQTGSHLQHLSPTAVLARGYSLVRNENGEIVQTVEQITIGEKLHLHFAQGSAEVQVRKRHQTYRLKK